MSDPIIEAAARALQESVGMSQYGRAEIIVAAVTPLIRAAALEEAAQVAEGHAEWGKGMFENSRLHVGACDYIAATIRALKEQPAESSAA